MDDLMVDIKKADATYKSFPSFKEWSTRITVHRSKWDKCSALLEEEGRGLKSPDVLKRARKITLRLAAIDTGAIEGLYQVDRGFTFTVAFQTATWEATLEQK